MAPRKLILPYSAPGEGDDARRFAPSAGRNAAAIVAVLGRHAPGRGRALELAAGTGQHSVACARAFPGLTWQPTDGSEDALASIAAWRAEAGLPNLAAPVLLDISEPDWGRSLGGQDLVFAANLLHLISLAEAQSVLRGMARVLVRGGTAALYGPFRRGGVLTSPGDIAFDANLRSQDPEIGYKDDAWVLATGQAEGLLPVTVEEMPANNLCFIFRRPA